MARVTYKGDHAAVFVVVDGAPIEAVNGEPVDVPAALARDLTTSPVWEAVSDKTAKRASAKADDPAAKAEKGTD